MCILIALLLLGGAGAFLDAAEGLLPSSLESIGRLDAAIPEASGIVRSRRHPGIFWVHNDSGNPPLLFAVRADGRLVSRYRLAVPNLDWEDIAIDDQGRLYVGEIGNNGGWLQVRTLYRVDEPDPSKPDDGRPLAASAVSYRLPASDRFDAEGLFLDGAQAVVVAKYLDGREAALFALPLDFSAKSVNPPRPIGKLPGFVEPATGADLTQDGSMLAVCSYAVTRVYRRAVTGAGRWEMAAEVRYPQSAIEGVAWDGPDLILAAEGSNLYRLRLPARRPPSAR